MYKHTQIGWVIIFSFIMVLIILGVSTAFTWQNNSVFYLCYVLGLWFFFVILGFLFASLTVSVDDRQIEVKFSIGLIKKKIPLDSIASCEKVKNSWWYGFGIRFIPKVGWMFNISGLDAVQVNLKNNKHFRIGTDDPDKLVEIINSKIK